MRWVPAHEGAHRGGLEGGGWVSGKAKKELEEGYVYLKTNLKKNPARF